MEEAAVARGDGGGVAASGTAVAASLRGLPRRIIATACSSGDGHAFKREYIVPTLAIKQLPTRRCLFRYVHRLIQFPISEYQSDCRETQAFPGLWTGPLNFVMHYR